MLLTFICISYQHMIHASSQNGDSTAINISTGGSCSCTSLVTTDLTHLPVNQLSGQLLSRSHTHREESSAGSHRCPLLRVDHPGQGTYHNTITFQHTDRYKIITDQHNGTPARTQQRPRWRRPATGEGDFATQR